MAEIFLDSYFTKFYKDLGIGNNLSLAIFESRIESKHHFAHTELRSYFNINPIPMALVHFCTSPPV